MAGFEDLGKSLEAEIERLRRFVTAELVPHSRRAAIEALRTASARLEELARDLEARHEGNSKQPQAGQR